MEKIKVAVLCGGRSAEHEVSLRSAENVIAAIDSEKYGVTKVIVPKDGDITELLQLIQNKSTDVVFPILHGPYGEDGTVQGLCALANLPCVGAGVLGSAVGMDKDVMKRLLRDAGIPIARFRTLTVGAEVSFEAVTKELGTPVFVKPANMGSSVGVSKVSTKAEWKTALESAFDFDTKVVVEEMIVGREVECAVLGNNELTTSVVGEIRPAHDFYSYDAKYLDEDGATLDIPADLPTDMVTDIQSLAQRVYQTLECRGLGRVDFFVTPDGTLKVIEINTLPGFTNISMYPSLFAESGIPYPELIDRLIQLALEEHAARMSHNSTNSGF